MVAPFPGRLQDTLLHHRLDGLRLNGAETAELNDRDLGTPVEDFAGQNLL